MKSGESIHIIPPDNLLRAYQMGIFPMGAENSDTGYDWYTANPRGVLPLEHFRISKNVLRMIRRGDFTFRVNSRFRDVIYGCADRESTWINQTIKHSYINLHREGFAHSVEVFQDDELAGGLYGVALGGAFFGESMFQKVPEASKAALYFCHKRLSERGYVLWDAQNYTEHLAQFGCQAISDEEYMEQLGQALERRARFV